MGWLGRRGVAESGRWGADSSSCRGSREGNSETDGGRPVFLFCGRSGAGLPGSLSFARIPVGGQGGETG